MTDRFAPIRTDDPNLNRVQDAIAKQLNPLLASAGVSTHAVPTGALVPFAGPGTAQDGSSAVPAGFLLCNGQAVSRETYSALFAAIGTTYGAGDGSKTFNLPDLRSRLPVGAGQGTGLTNRTLAATGGEESHQLTATESGVPAHTHGATESAHQHLTALATEAGQGPYGESAATVNNLITGSSRSNVYYACKTDAQQPAITVSNNAATGATAAHNTMPPFLAVNWIIAT